MMMLFRTAFLVALVTPSTTQAFTVSPGVARPPHHTSTTTALAISVPDVDPVVLAALGIAIVGGVGTLVLSGKIGSTDGDATPVTAAAPAPVADAPKGVVAEPTVDLSIPYDAAARLAYEAAGSKGDYAAFKAKYEADAVADVIAKKVNA
jgi:hypothetical protein